MKARKRNKKKTQNMESWITKFIAVVTTLSFFIYIGLVTFYPFNRQLNMEFVNLAMGWIGGVATSVISFYFGSSSGSNEKNELLSRSMSNTSLAMGQPPTVPQPPQPINTSIVTEKTEKVE